jgi:hypothetical protein
MAHEFAARGFTRRNYSRPRSIGYLLNEQLQDKLLSACKITPGLSWHNQVCATN